MKSYTDIKQSRMLAEFLPVESADMRYGYIAPYDYSDRMYDGGYDEIPYPKDFLIKNPNFSANEYDGELPCWSLATLLEELPYEVCDDDGNSFYLQINKEDDMYQLVYEDLYGDFESIETDRHEHFINACYEMILKLHELKIL
ncbi:hypothetical protein J6O48_07320 [bacterium]|nr:hypothetical protein [bacterium]